MKKIAIASEYEAVTEHFGHCKNFMIYQVENNKIINKESIPNPGHKPGFLPLYLADLGVETIISGGMGAGAIEIFNEKGVSVILGATGHVNEIINKFLKGNLQSSEIACANHHHLEI